MREEINEQVNLIKRDFRALMNGVLSKSLREKGLNYRLIYGIEWPRLVELSKEIGQNHDLAQALWQEDIRECRLLAGLVQPAETFDSELADFWMESLRYLEEAQCLTIALLQKMPFASEKAFQWIASDKEIVQFCGWNLLTRLFLKGYPLNECSENEFADQAETALNGTSFLIRTAVRNAVLKYALIGEREEHRMGKIINLCNF